FYGATRLRAEQLLAEQHPKPHAGPSVWAPGSMERLARAEQDALNRRAAAAPNSVRRMGVIRVSTPKLNLGGDREGSNLLSSTGESGKSMPEYNILKYTRLLGHITARRVLRPRS